jgi:hypothetical protein
VLWCSAAASNAPSCHQVAQVMHEDVHVLSARAPCCTASRNKGTHCACDVFHAVNNTEPTYWTTNRWGAPAKPHASLGVGGQAAATGTLEAKR